MLGLRCSDESCFISRQLVDVIFGELRECICRDIEELGYLGFTHGG